MTRLPNKCFAAILLCAAVSVAIAAPVQSRPPGWPWRGVNIEGNGDASDINKLASMKVNAVSLHLSPNRSALNLHLSPQEAWDRYLEWADQMLDACQQKGIVGIISLSGFPIDPNLGIDQASPEFWRDPVLQLQTVEWVGKLAEHFRQRGAELAAYDIISEPVERIPGGNMMKLPEQWPALQDALIRKIRQIDPKRYIITTPGIGGEPIGYVKFTPLNYPRIIYSAHMYDPGDYTQQGIRGSARGKSYPGADSNLTKAGLVHFLQPLIDFQARYKAYVYIGEFSAVRWAPGGDEYVRDLIDIFDSNKFSWEYFSYGGYHGWNPSFSHEYSSSDASGEWKFHNVGEKTPRWDILKKAFSKNP